MTHELSVIKQELLYRNPLGVHTAHKVGQLRGLSFYRHMMCQYTVYHFKISTLKMTSQFHWVV